MLNWRLVTAKLYLIVKLVVRSIGGTIIKRFILVEGIVKIIEAAVAKVGFSDLDGVNLG